MDFKQIMDNIKKENGEVPKPIELLGKLDEEFVVSHMTDKQRVHAKKAIPEKYKALIMLSAAIALDSQACILNNTKLAKKNGATVEEIMEVFALAKFSKGATVISSSAAAFEWLNSNK